MVKTKRANYLVMYKFVLLLSVGTLVGFSSCWKRPAGITSREAQRAQENIVLDENYSSTQLEIIRKRCVIEEFAPGEERGLYGKTGCFGKDLHLIIKTAEKGIQVPTSRAKGDEKNNAVHGLRTEDEVFINKVYNLQYELQKGKGDDKYFTWLSEDFLPPSQDLTEPFYGSPNTEYKIIFRLERDYLMLYKASTNLKKIPYIERTSEKASDSESLYMVPLIGYPVQYCNAKFKKTESGRETVNKEKDCQGVEREKAQYVYIDLSKGQNSYKVFKYEEKKDLFESGYFNGKWFYVEGPIEKISPGGQKVEDVVSRFTSLVTFERRLNSLALIQVTDKDGLTEEKQDIQKTVKYYPRELPVQWRQYKLEPNEFKEILVNNTNPLTSSFLTLELDQIREDMKSSSLQNKSEVIDMLVTPDYFSIVLKEKSVGGRQGKAQAETKYQIAFLREDALDNQHFHERKWFLKDSKYFGILFTSDDTYLNEEANRTQSENFKLWRLRRFNLDKPKNNIVRFFFSKNSSTETKYREMVKRAVQIYQRAFQMITQGSEKQVTVELVEDEPKDLGDLRYNIFNIVYQGKKQKTWTYGRAPTYVNPLTGQIIGGTINIFIDEILDEAYGIVRDYIRYEIFQKHKNYSRGELFDKEYHVVNDYLKAQIQKKCKDIQPFIEKHIKLYKLKDIKPDTELDDKEITISCGKEISEDQILFVMLHEIGHIFGLAHNFMASVDEANYYKNATEIQKYFPHPLFQFASLQEESDIMKTSSVMDYIPTLYTYPLTVLGKYDLEALRFLYMDQIKAKTAISDLKTPQDPDQQENLDSVLIQNNWKKNSYKSCPDWEQSRFLCLKYDYGSTPKDMVENAIGSIKRALNNHRYFYDIDPMSHEYDTKANSLSNSVRRHLTNIERLYEHYLQLRDNRFKGDLEGKNIYSIRPLSDDEDSSSSHLQFIENYQNIIEPREKDRKEYKEFFAIRDTVVHFVKNFYFMEVMKCKVWGYGFPRIPLHSAWIDLNILRDRLPSSMEKTWYVEDCYSKDIEDFLKGYGLKVIEQKGIENFSNYYSEHYQDEKGKLMNVKEFPEDYLKGAWFSLLGNAMKEPDIVDDLRETLEDFLLNREDLSNRDYKLMADILSKEGTATTNFRGITKRNNVGLIGTILFEQNKVRDPLVKKYTQGYFKPIRIKLDKGNDYSFYQIIVRRLKAGGFNDAASQYSAEPFLVEHYLSQGYKDYKMENLNKYREIYSNLDNIELDAQLFEEYISGLPNTVVLLDNDSNMSFIVMPFQPDSFYSKVIVRYNTNLDRIKELEEKEEQEGRLNFFQGVEKRHKEAYNLVLRIPFL